LISIVEGAPPVHCHDEMSYILSNYFAQLITDNTDIKIVREGERKRLLKAKKPLPEPPYILQRKEFAHYDVFDEEENIIKMGGFGLCLFASFLYIYKIKNPPSVSQAPPAQGRSPAPAQGISPAPVQGRVPPEQPPPRRPPAQGRSPGPAQGRSPAPGPVQRRSLTLKDVKKYLPRR
jgi:hypothetical protein